MTYDINHKQNNLCNNIFFKKIKTKVCRRMRDMEKAAKQIKWLKESKYETKNKQAIEELF